LLNIRGIEYEGRATFAGTKLLGENQYFLEFSRNLGLSDRGHAEQGGDGRGDQRGGSATGKLHDDDSREW